MQKQREEEEGTAPKRNKGYYERQVRRIQQRMRRLTQHSIDLHSSDEDEREQQHEDGTTAPVDDAPVIRRSISRRASRRRSPSPAPTTSSSETYQEVDSARGHHMAASGHGRRSNGEQSSASGKKRRRSQSKEGSRQRSTKKVSVATGSKAEKPLEGVRMEDVEAAEPALSPAPVSARAGRLSASSPTSASTAYLDPSLLTDSTPHRGPAAPLTPRSPGNVFQTEQHSGHEQHRTASQARPQPTHATVQNSTPRRRSALLHSSPTAAIDQSPTLPPCSTSPSSLRHRLSSLLPALFNNQPPPTESHRALKPNTQSGTLQSTQHQQGELSAGELKRLKQQEEETRARLAAVQYQLEQERTAKEEAERERRRLAQQVRQMELERKQEVEKKEVERRASSRPPTTQPHRSLANGVQSSTAASAHAINGSREKDELAALKAPVGFVGRRLAACRRLITFLLRLLAVMSILLLALMALQTSPVRRLLGLERDTLFCPSSLPSSVDGVYHGALVRFDGRAQCTACPSNGWCDEYGSLQCDATYVRQNNVCVKDGVWVHRALYFKEQAVAMLRDQLGRYECGQAEQRGLTGQQLLESIKFVPWWEQLLKATPPTEAEKEQALKQFVYAMRLIEQDTQSANVTHKPIHDVDVLNTTYAAVSGNHPLLCSLRLTAWHNKGKLALSGLVWCAAYYLYTLAWGWLWRRRLRPLLRQRVIAILQERAGEAVAIDHVRDHLWLGQDSSVWEWVVAEIERDSRVQPGQSKFGQVFRPSWCWVGSLPSGGRSNRKSGGSSGGGSGEDSDGSSRQRPLEVAPASFDPLSAHAAVSDTLPFATQPAIADSMFAPPVAAFSSAELSPPRPAAARQVNSGCVVC